MFDKDISLLTPSSNNKRLVAEQNTNNPNPNPTNTQTKPQ